MLRSLKELRGYNLLATDGEIGKVYEFYFDDRTWTIRYLVADTDSWLSNRLVLLSTIALGQPQWKDKSFPVEVSRETVENSPPIEKDEPVSRQKEKVLHKYYNWPSYWTGTGFMGEAIPYIPPQKEPAEEAVEEEGESADSHLRSTREVGTYFIQATDGEIGHVDDFIVDDLNWKIRYIVVDTSNWLFGKKVLVAPSWIGKVDWFDKKVHIDLDRDTIKNSPEFDAATPVNRKYEEILYDYYGRPKYWIETPTRT